MMNMKSVTCAAFAVLALAVEAQGKIWEGLSPQEFWAGRKHHPAVVHSVTAVKDGSIVSLAGLEGAEVVVGERLEALADFLRLIGAFRVLGEFLQFADLLFG